MDSSRTAYKLRRSLFRHRLLVQLAAVRIHYPYTDPSRSIYLC